MQSLHVSSVLQVDVSRPLPLSLLVAEDLHAQGWVEATASSPVYGGVRYTWMAYH